MTEQDKVVEQLKGTLPKAAVVDRRKEHSYGYRAVHVIATAQKKPIEIQVRTELQHLWAQLSEKMSDLLDPAIKYGGGIREAQGLLTGFSKEIAELEGLERGATSKVGYLLLGDRRGKLRQNLLNFILRLESLEKERKGS